MQTDRHLCPCSNQYLGSELPVPQLTTTCFKSHYCQRNYSARVYLSDYLSQIAARSAPVWLRWLAFFYRRAGRHRTGRLHTLVHRYHDATSMLSCAAALMDLARRSTDDRNRSTMRRTRTIPRAPRNAGAEPCTSPAPPALSANTLFVQFE